MNLNKFTEKAQEAVIAAPQLASEMSHAQVEPEHLLVTLAEQQGGVIPSVLRKINIDPAEIARATRDYLAKQPKAFLREYSWPADGCAVNTPPCAQASGCADDDNGTTASATSAAAVTSTRRMVSLPCLYGALPRRPATYYAAS